MAADPSSPIPDPLAQLAHAISPSSVQRLHGTACGGAATSALAPSFEHAVTSAIAECRGDLRVYAMACRTARPWPADWRASAPSGSPPSPRWPGRRRSRWPPGAGRASRCRSSRSTGRPTGPRRTAGGAGEGSGPRRTAGGAGEGSGPRLMIRRPAGPAIGVDEWARLWVRANEAEPEPRVERLPLDTIVRRWRGPSPGSDVDFYAVHGAATRGRAAVSRCRVRSSVARATPSTRLIWQFLHSHARDP